MMIDYSFDYWDDCYILERYIDIYVIRMTMLWLSMMFPEIF